MKKEVISQYKASLRMLVNVIKKCPDDLWNNNQYESSYWRIVYHTLYYASLYLDTSGFIPFKKHRDKYNRLGEIDTDNKPIIIKNVFTKNDMLEYADSIYNQCESAVNNSTLEEHSGFEWFPMNKMELHLYNIRHIQHHTGQLIERLHQYGIKGIEWETQGF